MGKQVAIGLQYAAFALVVLVGGIALAPCFSGRTSDGSAPADPSAADREELTVWSHLEGAVGYLLIPSGRGGETAAYDQRVLDGILGDGEAHSYWRLHVANFDAERPTVFELQPGTLTTGSGSERVGNVDLRKGVGEIAPRDRLILDGLGASLGRFELPPSSSRALMLGIPSRTRELLSPALKTENGEVLLGARRLPRGEIEDYLERPVSSFYGDELDDEPGDGGDSAREVDRDE